jgi:hypothetical protein
MSVDWERVERWKKLLHDDKLTELRGAFAAGGARGPSIKWNPAVEDLPHKPMKFALDFWTKAAMDGLPTIRLIDPIALVPALGYLLLVEVVDGGQDFGYRLFGTHVSAVSGFDMTHKKLSEHPSSNYIRDFSLALYRAALLRREPVWSHYGPAMAVSTAAWERVLLPLVDDEGTICRFLVATVPIGLNGNVLKG